MQKENVCLLHFPLQVKENTITHKSVAVIFICVTFSGKGMYLLDDLLRGRGVRCVQDLPHE